MSRTATTLLKEWRAVNSPYDGWLLTITDDEIERVSRVACKDGHPLQQDALAFLRALYDPGVGG
jgi:hypothetical protein